MLLAGMGVSTSCGLRETIERIHEAVKPEVFEIIWLRAVDGLTYKEIGDIAGKPEDTIGKCYVRAREDQEGGLLPVHVLGVVESGTFRPESRFRDPARHANARADP